MWKNLTEERALEIARRQIPGFDLDADGMGHKFRSPTGLAWVRGARISDEVFEGETLGTLNISAILRNIAGAAAPLQPIPLDENLLRNVSKIDINTRHASTLSKDRLKQPVLAIFGSDGLHIIDGAHRIYRLNQLRKKTVYARMLTPEVAKYARVKRWRQNSQGDWLPWDTVPDDKIEAEVAAGREFLSRLEASGAIRKLA